MTYCDNDIIQITEDYRLRVNTDPYTENPLEWGWGCEIHEIDNYRIWMGLEDSDKQDSPVARVAQELQHLVRSRKLTEEKRDRALHLFMVYTGDTRSFEIHEWRGYLKGDWATVVVLWNPENGGNIYESWAAYMRGDVFGVTSEVRKVYVNPEDSNDLFETWKEGDSIWGCYLEEGYTPEDVARENFEDFPRDEREENK